MRILFVAFPNSIHSARWINQVTGEGWDIHLAPSTLAPLHPNLKGKVIYHGAEHLRVARQFASKLLSRWPYSRGSGHAKRLLNRLNNNTPSQELARIIRKTQPDIIHSLVIQHAGYQTLAAHRWMKTPFPTWIVGNWGSNIYLFGRLAEHKEQIKEVLASCDYYTCECERDVTLARQFGFQGQILPVLPAGGGFDLENLRQFRQPGPTSSRRIILIKGYQNWAGRALAGLRAIELCADVLQNYRIVIQLASPDVVIAAELVAHSTGIPIEIAPHGEYMDAMRRFGTARIHIGLSISDGISQSLLESMVMGVFPIQSCTACANEWIEDGKSGFIVPPEDPHIIATALRRAVTEDDLVDQAVRINDETARQRLAYAYVQAQAVDIYKSVFAASRHNGKL
jgi:hypothetical protein